MMIRDQTPLTHLTIDEKNDHPRILETPSLHSHHAVHIISPHTTSIKNASIDFSSAYTFGEQLENLLHLHLPEVLDLSRHCDSAETARKTSSPYQINPSPVETSPNNTIKYLAAQPFISSSLLYKPMNTDTLNQSLYFPLTTNIHHFNELVNTTHPLNKLMQNLTCYPAPISNPTATPKHNTDFITSSSKCARKLNDDKEINISRPFKAFPRDPLVMAKNFAANDMLLDNPRLESYTKYRKRILEQIRQSHGVAKNAKLSDQISSIDHKHNNKRKKYDYECNMDKSSDRDSNTESDEKMFSSIESSTESVDFSDNKNNNTNRSNFSESIPSDHNKTINSAAIKVENSKDGIVKDADYYERRRKNNAAAKKSRDRRRIKEDEIAIRASYLERKNIELLYEIEVLKAQLLAYKSKTSSPQS